MESDIQARLAALERSNRQLRTWLLLTVSGSLLLATLALVAFPTTQRNVPLVAESLRVRELVVADTQGTVRVRLGAHLPDAVVDGNASVAARTRQASSCTTTPVESGAATSRSRRLGMWRSRWTRATARWRCSLLILKTAQSQACGAGPIGSKCGLPPMERI